jgi:outer membrane murein-binding lipoprotein Lpp
VSEAKVRRLESENYELAAQVERLTRQLDAAMDGLRWYVDDKETGGRARDAIMEIQNQGERSEHG